MYSNATMTITPATAAQTIQRGQLPTFSKNLFERFIEYTDRKDTTIKGYITCIRQFSKWLDENGIQQPKRENITAYRDYLKNKNLAAGTQSQYLRAVKHFFKWTAAEGLYPNEADNIHGAKVKHDCHKKDALPRNCVEPIAELIDRSDEQGKRLYAIYLLCVKCGLRTIEINRADVGDIKTVNGDTFLYVQPKGHDDKDSPKYLFLEAKEAIDDYLAARTDKYTSKSPLFVSTSNKGKPGSFKEYEKDKDGNLVYDADGNPKKVYFDGRIATTTISTMLKELLIKGGFDSDRITAHSLRATAATTAFEAGLSLFEVQQLMGHVDPATTEIYIKDQNQLSIEKKGRIAIDKYLKGELKNSILPELEAEIMTMSAEQQKTLLAQIRAQKG